MVEWLRRVVSGVLPVNDRAAGAAAGDAQEWRDPHMQSLILDGPP
jgi:hypothetical protein